MFLTEAMNINKIFTEKQKNSNFFEAVNFVSIFPSEVVHQKFYLDVGSIPLGT